MTASKSIVVSKFGGTSMGDAKCMLRSAEVAVSKNSAIVVVSATSGTTNQLIQLGKTAESAGFNECVPLLDKIEARHLEIAQELGCDADIKNRVSALLKEMRSLTQGIALLKDCSVKAMDNMMSFGERLSSELFVTAMRTQLKKSGASKEVRWLDARSILITDNEFSKARPQTEKIIEKCKSLNDCKTGRAVYVTQGFIGSTESGQTTTLGRGGSDYSAAIFAEGLGADILEIWTDVAGIATTDPRIVKEAKPIAEISFTEASELATFGAKVLHPATLLPALRKNIPVFVGSSFDPAERGTWVRLNVKDQPLVRAMALRRKQVLVTLSTPEMLNSYGFLYRIFKIFTDHQISIDSITTSEISVALTLDDSTLLNKKLLAELSQIAEVQVEENLSLVSVIGNNINHTPGLAQKIFDAIGDINVRMICLGASRHNFCFLVSETQGELAIQRLHSKML